MPCDFCGKPFTRENPGIPMDIDGSRMHPRCGARSESGEAPPIQRPASLGLFQMLPTTQRDDDLPPA